MDNLKITSSISRANTIEGDIKDCIYKIEGEIESVGDEICIAYYKTVKMNLSIQKVTLEEIKERLEKLKK